METNNQKDLKWDKTRQQIDQLNANVKKMSAKLTAIREYAESLPDDLDSVRHDILEKIQ